MEEVVERSNLKLAYQRVVEKKGAPGVDDVSVSEFKDWLKMHWPSVKAAKFFDRVNHDVLMARQVSDARVGPWWNAGASHKNQALPAKYFTNRGLVSLMGTHQQLQSLS